MAAINRIYTVTNINGEQNLVRTYSTSAAVAHVARGILKASVATPDELIELTKSGIEVEAPAAAASEEGVAE